ncbi:MAG: hypothetical protein LBJ67_14620 [Planctomycetaceae bacterium]|nr:hypothetical protein [Planctomycetaceae bacterium]
MYDRSSSYVAGECCPLAKVGHHRDGQDGQKIVPIQFPTPTPTHPRGNSRATAAFIGKDYQFPCGFIWRDDVSLWRNGGIVAGFQGDCVYSQNAVRNVA